MRDLRTVIPQGMVDRLLTDPVCAAQLIFGVDLDAFQKARLRHYWWVPELEDSSGFSSGKTIVDFIYLCLRCILIPNHHAAVFYPTFDTGKKAFWDEYFQKLRHPFFRSQLGRIDSSGTERSKANKEHGSCYYAYFRNGSVLMMPAADFVRNSANQSSLRLNSLLVEEWTHAEAMGDGIGQQLIGRVTRPCFNQDHPVWGNHIHYTAPARDSSHPSYEHHRDIERRASKGNPRVAYVTWCYKDYSSLTSSTGKSYRREHRHDNTIAAMKAKLTPTKFRGEGLGLWSKSARGLYSRDALDAAVDLGRSIKLLPVIRREDGPGTVSDDGDLRAPKHFAGVDPAPAQSADSDDGAIVVLRARLKEAEQWMAAFMSAQDAGTELPRLRPENFQMELVYGRRLRNVSAVQWSGLLHDLHQRFQFQRMGLDPGGGGQWIKKELLEPNQKINGLSRFCRPIASPDDAGVSSADYILVMIKRKDPGIESIWPSMAGDDVVVDNQHTMMVELLQRRGLALPASYKELVSMMPAGQAEVMPEELMWACRVSGEIVEQLAGMGVVTDDKGIIVVTRNGARQFVSRGKKDFVSALLNAYTAFLTWLESDDLTAVDAQNQGSAYGVW